MWQTQKKEGEVTKDRNLFSATTGQQDRMLQEIADLQADIEALSPLAKVWSKTKLMLAAQAATLAALAGPYWLTFYWWGLATPQSKEGEAGQFLVQCIFFAAFMVVSGFGTDALWDMQTERDKLQKKLAARRRDLCNLLEE